MPKTVGVAVSNATFHFDKLYTYAVMPDQQDTVRLGSMVLVPFGRGSRARMGVVLACDAEPESAKLKFLFDVAPASACLTPELLRLVYFLKERTFCTYYEAVKAVIPYGAQYKPAVVADGVTPVLQKQLTRHTENSYRLVGTLQQKPKPTAKQLAAVALLGGGPRTLNELEEKGISRAVLDNLCTKGVLECSKVNKSIDLYSSIPLKNDPIDLTAEQQAAYDALLPKLEDDAPHSALLYGVTGSGKTLVYLHLIAQALAAGQGAILLVPEISLTPQMIEAFSAYFGDTVAVLHSGLPLSERYDEWKRIRAGLARVVVGTRSAVFAPVRDLGLLIIDEEQEDTYKSESTPRYHARDVAKFRCAQHNALLLLGSATPDVVSRYYAETGRYHYFTLPDRFNARKLPDVIIADMKQELRNGNAGSISSVLYGELEENLRRGEQSILFLNRRGASKIVTCAECGATYSCPNCSVSLTYHQGNQMLICHHCGYRRRVDPQCPVCGGELRFLGDGTERIEADLHALFPGVETLRMDADAIAMAGTHEALLQRFAREHIPIMIGTQMITKGLNFENVTLVGVLNADQSLYVGDYRANERTFSLITQVIGRSGRGDAPGRAVIQTFTPANETIQQAARQDYDAFYRSEIRLRKLNGTPPFSEVLAVTVSGARENAVVRCCAYIRDYFRQTIGERAEVLGPAPLPVVRMNNRYRYRVTLYCNQSKAVRRAAANIVMYCNTEKSFRDVTVFADDNPLD